MIDAFLFVTDKGLDHYLFWYLIFFAKLKLSIITDDYFGGHGPKFVTIMDDINAKANTNITLAHDLNDEVEYQNLNKQKQ